MRGTNVGVGRKGITAFGNCVHRTEEDVEAKKRKQVGEHHDGSFGVYMAHKIQKLRHQNESFIGSSIGHLDETALAEMRRQHSADTTAARARGVEDGDVEEEEEENSKHGDGVARASTTTARLFDGIHIYVDGYTVPSKEEIRGLMLLYGGGFEHYETSRVTHIIATHLATSKLLQYKRMRHPPPVVRPEWILKCVEAKTLLPLQSFLYRGFADPTQASVLSSLSLSASSAFTATPKSPAPVASDRPFDANGGSESKTVEDVGQEDDDQNSFSESEGASDEEDHAALASQYASQRAAHAASQSEADDGVETMVVTGKDNQSAGALSTDRTNSTRDGPSFVRHFFAKSRLHHIGSWRTTFQQRATEFVAKYKGKPFARASVTSCDRVILHVDMDCFFVAVAIRDKPQYHDKPVAIAHSGNAGSSEISSCNYLAREKGLRAGMFMQGAKELCPELVVLPYQFEEIETCSFQIYDIFFTRTPFVQAMSCDEAYLEFGPSVDGAAMAKEIREAIYEATRCTASVGVSYNILLAKLATRQAKPNGFFQISTPEEAEPFLESLKITDLPGVGHRMSAKMDDLGLETLDQLRGLAKGELQHHFGKTTSEMLYNYARGVDHRPLSAEANMMRKSVSAVVNFGIRFQKWSDATEFMAALAEELSSRLKSLKVRTKCLTLQLKIRREGEPVEPSKFMGMGRCDTYSKSQILADATDSDLIISRTGIELLRQYQFPVEDFRGVGIQATKLVSLAKPVESKSGQRFRAWLAESEPAEPRRQEQARVQDEVVEAGAAQPRVERYTESLSQLNMSVLEELPEAIREEVLESYTRIRYPLPAPPPAPVERPAPPVSRAKGKQKLALPPRPAKTAARSLFANSSPHTDSMASSPANALNDIRFSQVDEDVYHSLPMAIRREIDAHAKRSKGSKGPKSKDARKTNDSTSNQPPPVPAKRELESIEQLYAALADLITTYDPVMSDYETAAMATRAAFDAIFSRILVEIEGQALDVALRMLRFARRKCHQLLAGGTCPLPELVREGFNHVLQQINRDLHDHYRSSFSSRLVAPL